MRSSRGFASAAPDYGLRPRPFKTRFRYGFMTESFSLARDGKSPDHYAKGTPSLFIRAQSHAATSKSEIRISKSEIRNKSKIPMLQTQTALFRVWFEFGHSNFEFVSDFEIRISDLCSGFVLRRMIVP
jgi:hypothetical protein